MSDEELELEVDSEEVETEEENVEEPTMVANIVDAIVAGDYNAASEMFNDEMMDRVGDAIDARRVEVGQSFNFQADDVDGETDGSEFDGEEVEDTEETIETTEE